MNRLRTAAAAAVAAVFAAAGLGCTGRGMTISSLPEGAEVSVNRRAVGKTPVRVGFTHYGTYRVELRKAAEPGEGDEEPVYYQALVRNEPLNPSWYGWDPLTAVADNFIPARVQDEVYLHYVMQPLPRPEAEAAKKAAGKFVKPPAEAVAGGRAAFISSDEEEEALEPPPADKSLYQPLLNRAVAARKGEVTHPLTGKKIVVRLVSGELRDVTAPARTPAAGAEPEPAAPAAAEKAPPANAEPPDETPPPAEPQPAVKTEKERKAPAEQLPFAPAPSGEAQKPGGGGKKTGDEAKKER
jgi:hypothetical protein